jgi:hypothetical protein
MFLEAGGWPFGEFDDTDPAAINRQREIPPGNPVRHVSLPFAFL